MNYKKIIIETIIYSIIIFIYTFISRNNYEYFIAMFYISNIFFAIIAILIYIHIPKNKALALETYRYKSKLAFVFNNILKYTINVFLLLLSILIINSLIIRLYGYELEVLNGIYYSLNYLMIFFIMYLLISCFTFSKYYLVIKDIIFCLFICLYMFCYYGSVINIFKYLMTFESLKTILVFYTKYIIVILPVLFIKVRMCEIPWKKLSVIFCL